MKNILKILITILILLGTYPVASLVFFMDKPLLPGFGLPVSIGIFLLTLGFAAYLSTIIKKEEVPGKTLSWVKYFLIPVVITVICLVLMIFIAYSLNPAG